MGTMEVVAEYLYSKPKKNRACANCNMLFVDGWECPRCGSRSVVFFEGDEQLDQIRVVRGKTKESENIPLISEKADRAVLRGLIGLALWLIGVAVAYNIFLHRG